MSEGWGGIQETDPEVGWECLISSVEKFWSFSAGSGEIVKDFKSTSKQICNWEYLSESFVAEEGIGLERVSVRFSGGPQFSVLLK